jgi:hypothetical protein
MFQLICRAYLKILRLEIHLLRRDFGPIHERVRSCRVATAGTKRAALDEICRSVDLACIFYFKEVHCLQRSAAAACLLRNHGIPAEMVIGVQQLPFRAHAWVEVEGCVVNDKPYMSEMYAVLSRC